MPRVSLLYIARRNIRRKWYRTVALVLAVAIASGALFFGVLMMESVRRGAELSVSMMGADVMVVPVGYEAQAKATLLAGEPSEFYMQRGVEEQVRNVPGVAQTSVQVFAGGVELQGVKRFLIGFDPATDFTVLRWVGDSVGGKLGEGSVVVGYSVGAQPGDKIEVYGHELRVWGKLRDTGIKYFDNSIFVPLETLYDIASSTDRLSVEQGEISAVLVKAEKGVRPDVLEVRIEGRVPGIIAIPMPMVLSTVRTQMSVLFGSFTILIAVLWVANALMVGAMFTTVVGERRKELGILRAVGANRRHVFTLILAEAAVLTAIGGMIGIAAGGTMFYAYKEMLAGSLSAFKVPYVWPPPAHILAISVFAFLSAVAMGVVGALYPAYTSARLDPYNAIRTGE